MGQENIPLTVNGLPDEEIIAEKDFSNLSPELQASLTRMAEIKTKRAREQSRPKFTPNQIADAKKHEAFHSPRQQD